MRLRYLPVCINPVYRYSARIPLEEVEDAPAANDKTIPDRPVLIEDRASIASGASTPRDEYADDGTVRRQNPELHQVWSADSDLVASTRQRRTGPA